MAATDGIESHYVDALGRRHRVPRATLEAIRRAMAGPHGATRHHPGRRHTPAGQRDRGENGLLVATAGTTLRTGPAELQLEDGRSLVVDAELPRDLPSGYHTIVRRGVAAARLIVAPQTCYPPATYRLVWFEKTRPERFPEQALAAVTTHDLPTIAGLWSGADLEVQKRLGLAPNEAGTREILARVRRLTKASSRTPVRTAIARVHDALGRAPSRILTATLEDAMAVAERPNMPATTGEWPNWSLALPRPIESLGRDALARRIARALGRGRMRRQRRHAGTTRRGQRRTRR